MQQYADVVWTNQKKVTFTSCMNHMTLYLTPVFKDESQRFTILTTAADNLMKKIELLTHWSIKILLRLLTDTCTVSSSPEDGAFPGLFDSVVLFVLRQNLGQAEIPDFHPQLAFHQNVSSGQVSVDVSLVGKVVHSLEHCNREREREKKKVSICTFVSTKYKQTDDALYYLADLWCIVQQFLGIKMVLVLDEIISQAAVGEIFHYQPQVSSSCRKKDIKSDTYGRKYNVWEKSRFIPLTLIDALGSKYGNCKYVIIYITKSAGVVISIQGTVVGWTCWSEILVLSLEWRKTHFSPS